MAAYVYNPCALAPTTLTSTYPYNCGYVPRYSYSYSAETEQQRLDRKSLKIKLKDIGEKKIFNLINTGKPLYFRHNSLQKFYLSHLYH